MAGLQKQADQDVATCYWVSEWVSEWPVECVWRDISLSETTVIQKRLHKLLNNYIGVVDVVLSSGGFQTWIDTRSQVVFTLMYFDANLKCRIRKD